MTVESGRTLQLGPALAERGLDDATLKGLRREILRLADSKRLLGLRYSDWLLGAPSIEAGIASSAMAQDEWGHARLLYAMLKDFGEDPVAVEHDRSREEYAAIAALDEPIDDWAGWVAVVVVVDGALRGLLHALAEGEYETARGRIPKMLAEEEFHGDLGRAWLSRLAEGAPEGRERITEEVARLVPVAARYVAPGDGVAARLHEAGLRRSERDLRTAFRDSMVEVLEPLLDAEAVDALIATDPGPDWDTGRGRAAGAPEEEVVERARGDRNRDLFVE